MRDVRRYAAIAAIARNSLLTEHDDLPALGVRTPKMGISAVVSGRRGGGTAVAINTFSGLLNK